MQNGITRDQHWEKSPAPLSDRGKILAWLNMIKATEDEVGEIIQVCIKDKEVRSYFLMRAKQDL